ncbi:hypothetical protein IAR55_000183 [Kwoniella newhampshirensis]|uniref:Aminopeptidase n=1 Tax=Kwoniella newhampshirensis TaxID=1651941 RepID=A0AAW0Z5Y9_9TREE
MSAPLPASSTPVPGGAESVSKEEADASRLPTDVYPSHYDLVVKTDLLSSPPTFSGEVIISLDVKSDTSTLHFHLHKELTVTHIAITSSDLKTTSSLTIPVSELKLDEEKDTASIALTNLPGGGLKAGSKDVKVFFKFESELRSAMHGYYKSLGDPDEDGKKPVYALTQFEATEARKAFPCWDEPLIKSKFTLSLISREGNTDLANMPEVSSKPWKAPSNASIDNVFSDNYEIGSLLATSSASGKTEGKTEASTSGGNWTITKFETSPLMSTYLVAYATGEFASLSSEHHSKLTGKTVPLRIFATKNLIKQAQFALDIKKWALPVYEEIFDIPYALPKLDTLVAHDFDAGAMENWGLITGRTTAYLYDPEKSPLSAKKRVAVVQCHELAHMWFGDIVTMKWWDNLWLNEAFATLMGELIILERVWPEWKPRSEFLKSHLQPALDLDSQRSSHPIEVDCPDSAQIGQIFDAISYSKGASVLRMLAGVVGEKTFLKGVSIYLKKHIYNNAETKDLWDGIAEASGLDIAKIMANWTLKIGYPVITVKELGNGKVELTQNRFLSTGDVKAEEDETLWYVPLEVSIVKDGKVSVDHKAILEKRSTTYDLGDNDTFKLNANTIGVYRVAYEPERLAKLGKQASSFTLEDRLGLVSDAATLARAGYAKTSGSLSLVKELGKAETEYLPWAQIGSAISRLAAAWWEQPEEVRKAIANLRTELFKPVVDKLGFDNGKDDAPDVKELRELAVSTAAAAEDADVLKEMKERFAPFLEKNDDSRIPPDLQRSIFVNVVEHGGKAEYEKMLEVYNKPANPSSKVDAMYALAASRDEALIERTFKMLSDGSVKDQDLYIFFFGFSANRYSRRKIAEYFYAEYDNLIKRYPDGYGLNYLIKGSFASLSTHKDKERLLEFFKDKNTKQFKLALAQTCDSIQAAADWVQRDKKDVEEWFMENKSL